MTRTNRNPKLDYRFVLVIHDDPAAPPEEEIAEVEKTQQVCMLNDNAMLWQLRLQGDAKDTLFDRCQEGYRTIIEHASDDQHWGSEQMEALPRPELMRFKRQSHLSRIDGFPIFRGTCTGFGSTVNTMAGTCMFCGDNERHEFALNVVRHVMKEEQLVAVHSRSAEDPTIVPWKTEMMTSSSSQQGTETIAVMEKPVISRVLDFDFPTSTR